MPRSLLNHPTRCSDIRAATRLVGNDGTKNYIGLFHKAKEVVGGGTNDFAKLYYLLPEELRRGEKINVNWLTTNPVWPDPLGYYHKELLAEKSRFAQSIFYTLLLLCYDEVYPGGTPDAEAITRLAQWSANFVDFIDPDSVMTPLIYKQNPFVAGAVYDNKQDIDKLLGTAAFTLPTGCEIVWGMEKPGVAMTETMGMHNRRVANAVTAKNLPCSNNPSAEDTKCQFHRDQVCNSCDAHDKVYNQVMIPQGSTFVELYRNDDSLRSGYTYDLYEPDGVLDLAQRIEDNGVINGSSSDFDYVWRIAAGPKTCSAPSFKWSDTGRTNTNDALYQTTQGTDKRTYSMQTAQWPGDAAVGNQIVPERIVWFGTQLPTPDGVSAADLQGYSYYNRTSTTNSLVLSDNEYLVIGPRESTTLESAEADGIGTPFGTPTKSVTLSGMGSRQIVAAADLPSGWTAAADEIPHIGFNVSEPIPGGSYYPQPTVAAASGLNEAYPNSNGDPRSLDASEADLHCFGTLPAYSTLFLQRLADPLRRHDPVKNPYITVDWNMVDLHVYNSETAKAEPIKDGGAAQVPIEEEQISDTTKAIKLNGNSKKIAFGSRQWGRDNPANALVEYPNLWNRVYDDSQPAATTTAKDLAGLAVTETTITGSTMPSPMTTFGAVNDYQPTALDGKPFLHFPWHDGPLNNSREVMMIPTCSASRFGVEFSDTVTQQKATGSSVDGSGMRFFSSSSNVGPYLNFYSSDSLPLTRFLDLIRVPSRFNGTIRAWTEPDTINSVQYVNRPVYTMREPGKININTADEAAWEALRGNVDTTKWPNYTALQTKRGSNGSASLDVDFQTPFRSPQAVNVVPVDTWVRTAQTQTGLLDETTAFIPRNSEALVTSDPELNPYTAVENTMRMGDLVTTRSNVFAVWVTVGYFKADQYATAAAAKAAYGTQLNHIPNNDDYFRAVYPDGYILGAERGLSDGTVKRHRAFYLIDRSTPVGFRRGDATLNYEDVIVDKTILE